MTQYAVNARRVCIAAWLFTILSLIPSISCGQTAYTFNASPLSVTANATVFLTDCSQRTFSEPLAEGPAGDIGSADWDNIPLLHKNGAWIPASITIVGNETNPPSLGIGNSIRTTTYQVDANGLISSQDVIPMGELNGFENSPIVTYGSSVLNERLNLQTGDYVNSFTNTYAKVLNATCSFNPTGITGHAVVTTLLALTPIPAPSTTLRVVDPSRLNGGPLPLSTYVDPSLISNAPAVNALSADGASAAVVIFQSNSDGQVQFDLSAPGASGPIGSLTGYDPAYLVHGPQSLPITSVTPCPGGPCTYLVLLWSPPNLPDSGAQPVTVTVSQAATSTQPATSSSVQIGLLPPPVVLIHGIWSDGNDWAPFGSWLELQGYQDAMINIADYGLYKYLSFADPRIQGILTAKIRDAIVGAAKAGVVARKVDIVAHSMGGLATRFLMENGPPSTYPHDWIPTSPIHKLITVATPFDGSELATELWNNVDTPLFKTNPVFNAWCAYWSLPVCTLGAFFKSQDKQIDTGVLSLEPDVTRRYFKQLIPPHAAVVGLAPTLLGVPSSPTEVLLNLLIGAFVPNESVATILGAPSDTIVTATSQGDGATTASSASDLVTVDGVVHAPLVHLCATVLGVTGCADEAETKDSAVWSQILKSLQGEILKGEVRALIPSSARSTDSKVSPRGDTPSAPPPFFDLTNYTQVAISNVNVSPANNSVLALGSSLSIAASSASKTLSEIFIIQSVQNSLEPGILYATQSPFTLSFIPQQLGAIHLLFFAVFSDNTYATFPLSYSVQTTDSVVDVRIPNPPIASLYPSQTLGVDAIADYPTQAMDVANVATYTARSKTSSVFSVGSGGEITAMGNGVDWLDVSYGGQTASTLVSVGTCTYALSPTNQLTNYSGGASAIQIMTQPGCSWIASSDSSWLTLSTSVGSGPGTIQAIVTSNTRGAVRSGHVTVGSVSVAITQPTTACTYSVTPTSLALPPSGGQGALNVTTSCPIISSSDQTWADAVTLNSNSVEYVIDANTTTQQRAATLTIGTQKIQITEGGGLLPQIGINPILLTFPNQVVGTASQSLSATVSNSGTAAMTISGVQLTGTNAAAFNMANGCGTSLAAGATCTISVTFRPAATGSASATISITDNAAGSPHSIALTGVGLPAPDFTISATPSSLTIVQGSTGSSSISVSPTAGYNQPVSLICSGLPSNATCSFSPGALTPSGSSVSTQLTIQTKAPLLGADSNGRPPWRNAPTMLAALIGTGFLARRRKRLGSFVGIFVFGGILLGLGGCGGGASTAAAGTPKGSYSVTVTATGGSATAHTVAIDLTVN